MRPQLNDQFEQLPIEVLRDVIDTYVTEKQPSDADIEACEALRKSIDPHSSVPLDYDKFEKLLSSGTPLFSGRLRKKLAPHLISRSAYKTTKSFPDGHNMIGCNSSATIAIVPDTIRSFAPNAFTDCPKLAHIICTETQWGLIIYYLQRRIQGVTIIGDHKYYLSSSSFSGYRSLVYIGIPDTVTTIGSSAFRGCINLRYPMLPNTITTIDDYAFADCTFSEFVFPPAVKIIEEEVLHNCFNLTKIELPAQTTSIGDYAFSGTAISNLFIPRTVIGAWRHAFSNCPSLAIIRAEDFESLFITITNHAVIIPRHTIIVDNHYNPRYAPNVRDWIKPDGFDTLPVMHKALSYTSLFTDTPNVLNQFIASVVPKGAIDKYVASVVPKGATALDCVNGRPTFWSNLSVFDRQRVTVLMLCAYRSRNVDNPVYILPDEICIMIATIVLAGYLPGVKATIKRGPDNRCLSVSVSPINTINNLFRDGPDAPTESQSSDESKAPRQQA